MKIDMRQAAHPRDIKRYDTAELRADFLIENLFEPDALKLTYSHYERMIIGGATPGAEPIALAPYKPTGAPFFLARRELGIFNIGGPGTVMIGGHAHDLDRLDALYVDPGHEDVRFASADSADPAKFYLLSTPAHHKSAVKRVRQTDARKIELGSAETANKRVIHQYLMPDVCGVSQLVMGMTMLVPGSVWNTMPSHTHDRRSEAYLYFDLLPDARVLHLMGEPTETRHIVVANEQAVICPNWSVHSGCGTSNYGFIWGMGGDNVEYADMDPVPMDRLR